MIDPSALAKQHAQSLNQPEDRWEFVVRLRDFEFICQELSDGQIQKIIALCQAPEELQFLSKGLASAEGSASESFDKMIETAQGKGIAVQEWIKAWAALEQGSHKDEGFVLKLDLVSGLFERKQGLDAIINELKS